MIDFSKTDGVFFVGIGGIGMSALALYFRKGGFAVAGYDRSAGAITDSLAAEGCDIIFADSISALPGMFSDTSLADRIVVVYTPAIPAASPLLSFFRSNGYRLYKRSEILGAISENTDTLAIAGTHGKTTVSTMTAHLLKQSSIDCSAFLGGISKNYESNLILGSGPYTVMEADEFDRSFHRLSPLMAVITALDADHLDIYGTRENMVVAYNEFCAKIRAGGSLVVNSRILDEIIVPEGVKCYTYGLDEGCDFRAFNIEHTGDHYRFDMMTPSETIEGLLFSFPGLINIENFTAAIAIATLCGVTHDEIRKAVLLFRGVRRRFDIRVNIPGLVYVDDYAHHPDEIKACINSLREFFAGRRITGIFQPHLFSRTADHAAGFAEILDKLDDVIILPIYPARELPMEGVTSALIYDKMKSPRKRLLEKSDIPGALDIKNLDVLVTIGAGDIDTLASPIEKRLIEERG